MSRKDQPGSEYKAVLSIVMRNTGVRKQAKMTTDYNHLSDKYDQTKVAHVQI